MNPKQLARWERTRAKGQARFIWLRATIGWGVTTALVMPFAEEAVRALREGPAAYRFPPPDLFGQICRGLFIYPLGGFFCGTGVWQSMERQYAVAVAGMLPGKTPLPRWMRRVYRVALALFSVTAIVEFVLAAAVTSSFAMWGTISASLAGLFFYLVRSSEDLEPMDHARPAGGRA